MNKMEKLKTHLDVTEPVIVTKLHRHLRRERKEILERPFSKQSLIALLSH